ncbi:MAG: AMP-binding protein [Nevskia sp.]|nr:AMP-binding protein [Nevskia sp.]
MPLIVGYRPQAPLLYTDAGAVSQAAFLAQAGRVAAALPESRYVLNLCESRRNFALGFAAALMRGQASLLPPDRVAATVAAIRQSYGDSHVLADADVEAALRGIAEASAWMGEPPAVPCGQLAALPFTSGSTGAPVPHEKTWGGLVTHAALLSERLGFAGAHIAATVPPQHTYGLETSVIAALAGGAAVHCARPFFPQDLDGVLRALPSPRLLVTTPVHLRALVQAQPPLPPLARIISATAPLPAGLAAEAEQRLGTAVYEIYGSTESGAVATRRTVDGELWQPLPGVNLRADPGGALATGPHLAGTVRLADIIEEAADGHVRLLGRSGDMLKVAGKRMSLAELNRLLLAIPGVEDGVVFMPGMTGGGEAVERPAAVVVAPELSERQILDALRRSVDPAFLPRPLRRVAGLPRNAVGKVPRAALLELMRG